jgi:hypothetical protein
VAQVLQEIFDERLHGLPSVESPPPLRQHFLRIAACVQNGRHANFLRHHGVKNAIGKTVQIQPAHAGKANRISQRPLSEAIIGTAEILGEFQSQAGALAFIPGESRSKINSDEPMPF